MNPPSAPSSDGVVTLRLSIAEDVARPARDRMRLSWKGFGCPGGGLRAVDPLIWAAERLDEFNNPGS
jgi:hypothetical protein